MESGPLIGLERTYLLIGVLNVLGRNDGFDDDDIGE